MSILFCFKQKTAYEMRISDWSSDVCSSDLYPQRLSLRLCPCVQHRQVEALLAGAVDGVLVAGVGVAHDAGSRVVPQHALDSFRGGLAAVADDDHAGVLREAHADAAAVVQRHPGGAAGGVQRSEEHTSELQSLMRISYAVLC